MLFIELVISFVLSAVLPHIYPIPMHDSLLKLPFEEPTVAPLEAPIATHLIVDPHAGEFAPVGPEVDTLALLNSVLKIAVVVAAVAPHLHTSAILSVIARNI